MQAITRQRCDLRAAMHRLLRNSALALVDTAQSAIKNVVNKLQQLHASRNAMLALGVRYSVGSSIGLPLAIAIGETALREFLAGTHVMDDLTPAFWPG